MSAAEKLRVLDEEMPWRGNLDPGDFGGLPYSPKERALGYGTPDDPRYLWPKEFRTLGRALPQIVAVVEAATHLHEAVEMDESVGVCLSSRGDSLNLGAALAALDEALTADGKTPK